MHANGDAEALPGTNRERPIAAHAGLPPIRPPPYSTVNSCTMPRLAYSSDINT